ncbi:aspartyl-phosphate phosphatase Spo0E family protein [Neobacillus mesonae]|nr:aspartyl-phosphate phosphatase Spo0E family protein [Neobacillus mesonae]
MFCAEYDLPTYRGQYAVDNDNSETWLTNSEKASSRDLSLEDEIHILRSKMERIFLEEKSFTSDVVIEISSLLDLKINEYMKAYPKKA